MALKFKCQNCSNEIISKFLKIGEKVLCKKCGSKMIIPDTAITFEIEKIQKEVPKILVEKKTKIFLTLYEKLVIILLIAFVCFTTYSIVVFSTYNSSLSSSFSSDNRIAEEKYIPYQTDDPRSDSSSSSSSSSPYSSRNSSSQPCSYSGAKTFAYKRSKSALINVYGVDGLDMARVRNMGLGYDSDYGFSVDGINSYGAYSTILILISCTDGSYSVDFVEASD